MAAPANNTFWKLRSVHGRDKIFESPASLWDEACKYFEDVDNNPIIEPKVFSTGQKTEVARLRPYTIEGLCYFLGIGRTTWGHYCKRDEFKEITEQIEQVIYNQKFSLASANVLNANIIARDLGLVDRQEQKIVTEDQKDYSNLTDDELLMYSELEKKLSPKPLLIEQPLTLPVNSFEPDLAKEESNDQ